MSRAMSHKNVKINEINRKWIIFTFTFFTFKRFKYLYYIYVCVCVRMCIIIKFGNNWISTNRCTFQSFYKHTSIYFSLNEIKFH